MREYLHERRESRGLEAELDAHLRGDAERARGFLVELLGANRRAADEQRRLREEIDALRRELAELRGAGVKG
ncbi:MAG TPA: hypothetical protein VFT76_00205 [Actinomycetota bacterium]|nr:hypothetical protein [Actinomycetota bacterium]